VTERGGFSSKDIDALVVAASASVVAAAAAAIRRRCPAPVPSRRTDEQLGARHHPRGAGRSHVGLRVAGSHRCATITADVAAAALSAAISSGGNAVSLAVAVTLAENTITNTTRAVVEEGSSITAGGDFDAHASSTGSIDAFGLAASLSVGVSSGGTVGLSGAGAGVGATNTITNTIEAGVIGDSSVDAGGAASISATDSASIDANVAPPR
jgi:hypothetical protein